MTDQESRTEPQPELRPVPRRTPEEISEIVHGLVQNRYFVATMAPPEEIRSIFLPLGLAGMGDFDPETLGNVIEEYDKASPRSINGWPMFMSCQFIHKEDWTEIADRYQKVSEAVDKAMKETST